MKVDVLEKVYYEVVQELEQAVDEIQAENPLPADQVRSVLHVYANLMLYFGQLVPSLPEDSVHMLVTETYKTLKTRQDSGVAPSRELN